MYIDFLLYSNRTYLCITDGLVLCLEILHRCHQYYPWGYCVMCHPFSERFCILRIHPSIFKVTRIKLNILGILIQKSVVCILRWVWKCWEIVFERRFGKFTWFCSFTLEKMEYVTFEDQFLTPGSSERKVHISIFQVILSTLRRE